MAKDLTEYEELLVELVHFIAQGSKTDRMSLREVKKLITTPMPSRRGKTCLEMLEKDGKAFINELKTYINETED